MFLSNELIKLQKNLGAEIIFVEPLTKGLTNQCLKLTCADQKQFVWRPNNQLRIGISRRHEYQVLKSLEGSGLAPKPILLNEFGLLVEWIEPMSTHQVVSDLDIMTYSARLHQWPVDLSDVAVFDHQAHIQSYWQKLPIWQKTPLLIDIHRQFGTTPDHSSEFLSLCHFDLGRHNLVSSAKGLIAIDWEYAAMAPAEFDLSCTLVNATLFGHDQSEKEAAMDHLPDHVAHYCHQRGITHSEKTLEGVKVWLGRAQWMSLLWFLLVTQSSSDEKFMRKVKKLENQLVKKLN